MKKTLTILALGQLLFAEGLYTTQQSINIDLTKNIILKASTTNKLKSMELSDNNFLISDNTKVKIFDLISKELIKSIPSKNIKQAKFSEDKSKLLVLTQDALFIVDAKKYKILSTLKGNYNSFDEKNNILVLSQNYYNGKVKVFDLKTGKLLSNLKKHYITNVKISPNSKKVALVYDSNIYIYDLNGNLLNTINSPHKIFQIEWMNNKYITVFEGYRTAIKYDVITSKVIAKTPKYDYADRFVVLDENKILIGQDNKAFIFDFSKNKITKRFSLNENNNINIMKLKNNILAVGYYNNAYLYKTNLKTIHTKPATIIKKQTISKPIEQKPKVIIKEKVVTKIVEKKVYIKEHKNQKPTLEIYASKTSGIIPLKVNFKIIANDEDGKIVSYYINFAGKEVMAKGNPTKPFSYTFENPGNYKVMVAVKDNKNAVTTKQIIIKAREESFRDFEKELMGN